MVKTTRPMFTTFVDNNEFQSIIEGTKTTIELQFWRMRKPTKADRDIIKALVTDLQILLQAPPPYGEEPMIIIHDPNAKIISNKYNRQSEHYKVAVQYNWDSTKVEVI